MNTRKMASTAHAKSCKNKNNGQIFRNPGGPWLPQRRKTRKKHTNGLCVPSDASEVDNNAAERSSLPANDERASMHSIGKPFITQKISTTVTSCDQKYFFSQRRGVPCASVWAYTTKITPRPECKYAIRPSPPDDAWRKQS